MAGRCSACAGRERPTLRQRRQRRQRTQRHERLQPLRGRQRPLRRPRLQQTVSRQMAVLQGAARQQRQQQQKLGHPLVRAVALCRHHRRQALIQKQMLRQLFIMQRQRMGNSSKAIWTCRLLGLQETAPLPRPSILQQRPRWRRRPPPLQRRLQRLLLRASLPPLLPGRSCSLPVQMAPSFSTPSRLAACNRRCRPHCTCRGRTPG